MDVKGAERRHNFGPIWPEVIPGLGLAPTSRFSQKIATVATVALLAVLRRPACVSFLRKKCVAKNI